ncbi:aminotransferase class I/II-fold pyridoxal phosphate-dependent enzyme [Lentilactobacillus buchneri]|uniref:trans-sulfuration enzyme family protein n=1 Tax=Lentilactobacillus buchneri TaxID=1581 RepID=UPI0021A349AC|nr:aminotransferase class I/II-fold pyridoxal phosphate-dependent enzyme [Lentilactobacillus buchneri]MCT3554758.1 aminotransferase class I/II-fold pyridoxal phosphate-dependent enzyme [Lentilactobacillus buchneri]MCT3556545.1 aminotransferase class I/II-fold pyridoxal phosphate-dependent enzyme [Lentilactobacillus buchneri]MCT3559351.1 aminotransferase class I/II-fold pyridoxal phosphate-dependent enzyme [Lentilactobacillus buchneri]MCT3562877.1 aminotransferase class I/II-fold pyridoxal phosp
MSDKLIDIDTLLAQAGNRDNHDQYHSVSTPIYLTSNFRHRDLEDAETFDPHKQYSYSRLSTPTRSVLQKTLADLEGGANAFAVSSGMAAIQLVFSLFKSGDEIITSDDLYGGSFRYFDYLADHYGVKFSKWNGKDYEKLSDLVTAKTKAVWLETPSNPTMKIIDIQKVADLIHAANQNALVCVDNTFLTPVYQQPLREGADIVVHSATKYLSGHNDMLAGCVIAKSEEIASELEFNFNTTGVTLDPFDSWLLLRSLKTLAVRMERHTSNAKYVAACLKKLPQVQKVLYPGVGGMISFYLQNMDQVDRLFKHLKIISFAESLGGVESLLTIPSLQTHSDMAKEDRLKLGVTDELLRLSTGLENPKDLANDLTQALGD